MPPGLHRTARTAGPHRLAGRASRLPGSGQTAAAVAGQDTLYLALTLYRDLSRCQDSERSLGGVPFYQFVYICQESERMLTISFADAAGGAPGPRIAAMGPDAAGPGLTRVRRLPVTSRPA